MNPLWVHLRVLHETYLALSQVTVLRGNLRVHLKAHVTLIWYFINDSLFSFKLTIGECKESFKSFRTLLNLSKK